MLDRAAEKVIKGFFAMNEHDWRKFEQAQRNMMRLFGAPHSRRRRNRLLYWARQMRKTLEIVMRMPT